MHPLIIVEPAGVGVDGTLQTNLFRRDRNGRMEFQRRSPSGAGASTSWVPSGLI